MPPIQDFEEWSSIRGISAYRFWDIAIENVVVKSYIWNEKLPFGSTAFATREFKCSYLMDGKQPPLIIALECEIEKGGPRSPLSKGKF